MPEKRILLIEDDDVISAIIEDTLAEHDFSITTFGDGREGWDYLQAHPEDFDSILLDRSLPGLQGMEILRRIKSDPRLSGVPVIMETGSTEPEDIQAGINAGAHYYLTKPFKPEVLLAITQAAVSQFKEHTGLLELAKRDGARPFALLDQGTFHFRTIDEAHMLANFFAQACNEPGRVIIGLQELLLNAVEHGNLGITYAEKSALLVNNGWKDEVERRLALPEQQTRYVEVVFERRMNELAFTIKDQGNGFEWEKYLEFDPERIFDPHGRGIAMARRMSFDYLEYQGNGNTVSARILRKPAEAVIDAENR